MSVSVPESSQGLTASFDNVRQDLGVNTNVRIGSIVTYYRKRDELQTAVVSGVWHDKAGIPRKLEVFDIKFASQEIYPSDFRLSEDDAFEVSLRNGAIIRTSTLRVIDAHSFVGTRKPSDILSSKLLMDMYVCRLHALMYGSSTAAFLSGKVQNFTIRDGIHFELDASNVCNGKWAPDISGGHMFSRKIPAGMDMNIINSLPLKVAGFYNFATTGGLQAKSIIYPSIADFPQNMLTVPLPEWGHHRYEFAMRQDAWLPK